MISLASNTRIFVFTESIDMRKSFNGLSGIVKEHFEIDLFSGHLFVFFNRRRDFVKILLWDHDGLAIWSKKHKAEDTHFNVFTEVGEHCTFAGFIDKIGSMDGFVQPHSTRRNAMPAKPGRTAPPRA